MIAIDLPRQIQRNEMAESSRADEEAVEKSRIPV